MIMGARQEIWGKKKPRNERWGWGCRCRINLIKSCFVDQPKFSDCFSCYDSFPASPPDLPTVPLQVINSRFWAGVCACTCRLLVPLQASAHIPSLGPRGQRVLKHGTTRSPFPREVTTPNDSHSGCSRPALHPAQETSPPGAQIPRLFRFIVLRGGVFKRVENHRRVLDSSG